MIQAFLCFLLSFHFIKQLRHNNHVSFAASTLCKLSRRGLKFIVASRTFKLLFSWFSKMSKSLVFILFFSICVLSKLALSRLSTQRIEECLKTATGAPPKPTKSSAGRQLFLYFGDAGIEAVSVLKDFDIKRINALAKCTALEDTTLFDDRYFTNTLLQPIHPYL